MLKWGIKYWLSNSKGFECPTSDEYHKFLREDDHVRRPYLNPFDQPPNYEWQQVPKGCEFRCDL